jgi:16S rRNA processing protein RimM
VPGASKGGAAADVARNPGQVVLGRILGAFGVKGWVRLRSYTEPPEAILDYQDLRLVDAGGVHRGLSIVEGRRQGHELVARLDGVEDRDAAQALGQAQVVIDRALLPRTGPGQYYWHDLIGLDVVNLLGESLGRIDHFVETPANPVMVVRGEREHLLPLVPKHLKSVDLMARRVVVDWDPTEY